MDSQLKLAQEQLRKQQRQHKQEMEAVVARKQQLEEMNHHLRQNPGEVWESIRDLNQYKELLDLPNEKISIQECVSILFYEALTPLRSQPVKVSVKRDRAAEELDTNRTRMKGLMESYEEERRLRAGAEESEADPGTG